MSYVSNLLSQLVYCYKQDIMLVKIVDPHYFISYQQMDEYLTLPIVHTNRLIVEYYKKQVASGVVMSTDSLPHYRPGDKDMSFYHLSSVSKEQNMPKL